MKVKQLQSEKKTTTKSGSPVRLLPDAADAIARVQSDFPDFNRQVIANRAVELLGMLDVDTVGTIIGGLPASRRPDFARLILQQLADTNTPAHPRLAAKSTPTSRGKRPPQA